MMGDIYDIAFFVEKAAIHSNWNWYAIADGAQSSSLPGALLENGATAHCLLGASQGTPLAARSPHLVPLSIPDPMSKTWQWISVHGRRSPCVSVIATPFGTAEIFAHLKQFTDVILPDDDVMFFAFWDPAILGTLLGQADDLTLHVHGPVLTPDQSAALLHIMEGWWYWDRQGNRHQIDTVLHRGTVSSFKLPLQLDQSQVDALVEASVPDHILYYLDLNQPILLEKVEKVHRYVFVRSAILDARRIGLLGMQDLLNYVCAALIYGTRLQDDPQIKTLMNDVMYGKVSFTTALNEMPE